MIENNPTNVFAAFEILLEEIETEIDLINKVGARAFERRDYDGVKEAIKRADRATTLRDNIASLRKEWETLTVPHRGNEEEEEAMRAERRNLGRLQRGMRTPESAYYQPILRVLNELGGSAKMNDVLVKVEQAMRGILKQVDYEPLTSGLDMRWRNTAQWARNSMVRDGLLKSNSPKGVWEITDAGRLALAKGIR